MVYGPEPGRLRAVSSTAHMPVLGPRGKTMTFQDRLMTFYGFSLYTAVSPPFQAAAGFYYSGYKNHIKCCYCNNLVKEIMKGDDFFSDKFHVDVDESKCKFSEHTNGELLRG